MGVAICGSMSCPCDAASGSITAGGLHNQHGRVKVCTLCVLNVLCVKAVA